MSKLMPARLTGFSTRQEEQDLFNDHVGEMPAEMRATEPAVNICRLKEVGDQPVNGQLAIKLDPKDLEVVEHLGEGEESSTVADDDWRGKTSQVNSSV